MAKFKTEDSGVIKRKQKREVGLFIDGTGLDRATRRIKKKVDLSRLVAGVTAGSQPVVARYYTLVPYEDDSRQRAFLDAVLRAGLKVIVKRLPPKGINRTVSVDVEMASDMLAFALGHYSFSSLSEYDPISNTSLEVTKASNIINPMPFVQSSSNLKTDLERERPKLEKIVEKTQPTPNPNAKRILTVVCPSRDLSYPISLCNELNVETLTADFGQFNQGDILKSASKWIDLSDSETIWRD